MEKLIEMERAGVALYVFGPGFLGSYHKYWNIQAKKEDAGIKLEISTTHADLPTAIDDIYEKWVAATKGLPQHGLKQIEHESVKYTKENPPVYNDHGNEIPF